MKLSIKKAFGFLAIVAMVVPTAAFADSSNADLENQVKALTKKVAALESTKSASSTGTYVMPTEGDAKQGGLIHLGQDIDFGGYVATSYTNHIDQNTGFQGKVYDANEGFNMNQADFYFKKDAPAEGGAGFKIDILAGRDNSVMQHGTTGAAANDSRVDFNEAYVEFNAPTNVGGGDILPSVVNVKAGRMVTLAGREVIKPQDNWNISRSVAFGFGLPFRHTGVRTQSKWFNEKVDFYAGINNGWDNDVETNGVRTLEFATGFSPIENVKYFTTILWGAETAGTEGHRTFLWTHNLDWSVTKALSLGLDIDWGHTNHPIVSGTALETGNWQDFAGYARYQINDKWAGAYRMEIFREATPRGVLNNGGTTGNETLFGNTFTLEYAMYENLVTRLEYRLDKANNDNGVVFGGDSSRNTLAAQMIYTI